jgi:hypothetical protein
MQKGIYFDGNLEFKRPRTLGVSESQPQDVITSKEDDIEEIANAVFSNFENASDKANVLMNYISKVANKYVIPVPEESFEIRAAVTRFDLSDGSVITFETFQNCIAIIESLATNVDFKVIDTKVTADPLANERRIRKQLDSRFKSSDDGLLTLLLVGSQIGVLYLIHEICGLWRGPEHVSAASSWPASEPGATTEALREVAISAAVSAAVLGINNAMLYLFASQNTKKSEKTNTLIEGAISNASQIDLPPLVQMIKKAMSIEDYKVIFEYCLRYISTTNERGYEFWLSYVSARKIRYLSARNRSVGPMFSKKLYSANKGTRLQDGPLVSPGDIRMQSTDINMSGYQSTLGSIAGGLAGAINAAAVTPNISYLCAMEYESNAYIDGLSKLAQVLDTRLGNDTLCCFIRFFGGLDRDLLIKIRTVLNAYMNFQLYDLNKLLENFESALSSWITDTVLRLIYSLVQAIIDKLLRMVIEFINELAGDIQFVIECPVVLEAIQGILDAIFAIARDIDEIIKNYMASLVYNLMATVGLSGMDQGMDSTSSMYLIYKKRRFYEIIKILDAIINALETAHVFCDEPDPDNPLQISYNQIVESPLLQDLNDYLNIPSDVKNSYFKEATAVMLDDGTVIPDYSRNVIDIGSKTNPSNTIQSQDGDSYAGCINQMEHIIPKDVLKKFGNNQN